LGSIASPIVRGKYEVMEFSLLHLFVRTRADRQPFSV
jgi:hypothetical protein